MANSQTYNPFINNKDWFNYYSYLIHSGSRVLPNRDYIFRWHLTKELHNPLINYLRKLLLNNNQPHLKKFIDEAQSFILTLISCEDESNDDYCNILIPCQGIEIIAISYVLFDFWCNSYYQEQYTTYLIKGFYAKGGFL